MNDLFGLREYQSTAVARIESAWNNGSKAVCYQLPTGGGKTAIARAIIDNHYQGKKTIYVIAHRRTLVTQISGELKKFDINHGLITPDNPYIRYRVQVASLGTIIRRADKLPEPEMLIIEEAHHVKAKSYLALIARWSAAKILGITATPSRPDGSPLRDVMDKLILGPSMRELINGGFLSDYDYFAPSRVDMSDAKKARGDFTTKDNETHVGRQIIGDAVAHYRRLADHQPAIVSCASIAHAEIIARQFHDAGYRAKAVHSELDQDEIQAAINGLRTGKIELLMQCELLGEGIDIPGASVLIGLRPTASVVIFLQHIGRVLRKNPGKNKALILDHVGNWERHGLPDDERSWSLAGIGAKEQGESKYKRCPDCMRPILKTLKKCPHCGHEWIIQDMPTRIPGTVEGELINIREREAVVTVDWETLKKMIMDRARSLKEAIDIAQSVGGTHRQAFWIWTKVMRKSA